MLTIDAVYANGVLRPSRPLEFAECEVVDLAVTKRPPVEPRMTIEEWDRRIASASSYREWMALANSCPDPDIDDGYDVIAELNKNRRDMGERLPTTEDPA